MNLKKATGLTLVTLLLATPAFAQTADQTATTSQQKQMASVGKITAIDLARGTMTLDDGTQYTLPPSFQFTSAPALGQEVQVTYEEQNGQRVAHSVDAGWRGQGSD
jgi:Protein of unknown function (DUF1344)